MKDDGRSQICHTDKDLFKARSGGAVLRILGVMFRKHLTANIGRKLLKETLDATERRKLADQRGNHLRREARMTLDRARMEPAHLFELDKSDESDQMDWIHLMLIV